MAHSTPRVLAAELPLKAQTRQVRWMIHVIQHDRKAAEVGLAAGIDGRIVTFHGRGGEAQLKAIIRDKDVALYRWKRGLDLELRTALAQVNASQKCGLLTSDTEVIAALDAADLTAAEDVEGEARSVFDVSIGTLTDAEEKRHRDRRDLRQS